MEYAPTGRLIQELPLAAGAIGLAWRYVDAEAPSSGKTPLDLWGAGFATLALGALTWTRLTSAVRCVMRP